MSSEGVKSCPFCGSSKTKAVHDDGRFWMKCLKCYATGPACGKYDGEEDEPYTGWHSRPREAALEAARDQYRDLSIKYGDKLSETLKENEALSAELAALKAASGEEVEQLRVDAERYRWLRNKAVDAEGTYPMVSLTDDAGEQVSNWLFGQAVDKVVDAAIAAETADGASNHD